MKRNSDLAKAAETDVLVEETCNGPVPSLRAFAGGLSGFGAVIGSTAVVIRNLALEQGDRLSAAWSVTSAE
jgi:hypothetical protein